MGPRFVAVIDIGKTNAKLALVDLDMRAEIAALRQPNRPLVSAPIRIMTSRLSGASSPTGWRRWRATIGSTRSR